jgi:hypothetical protein
MKRIANFLETYYPHSGLFLLLGGGSAGFYLLPFPIRGDGSVRFKFVDSLVH